MKTQIYLNFSFGIVEVRDIRVQDNEFLLQIAKLIKDHLYEYTCEKETEFVQ